MPTPEQNMEALLAQATSEEEKQKLLQKQAQSVAAVPGAATPYASMLAQMMSTTTPAKTKESQQVFEEDLPMSPQTLSLLKMRAIEDENLQKLKDKQEELEALALGSALPPKTNLAPMLAVADALTGSRLASSYDQPSSTQDYSKYLMGLQDLIREGQMGITKAEADFIKSQLTKKMASKQEESIGKAGSGAGNWVDKAASKDISKYGEEFSTNASDLNLIDEALTSNDFGKLGAMKSLIARLTGEKGALSDSDIKRLMPSSFEGDISRFAAYFQSGQAKYDPALAKSLREIVDLGRQRLYEKVSGGLQTTVDTYGSQGWSQGTAQAAAKLQERVEAFGVKHKEKEKRKEAVQKTVSTILQSLGK